MSKIPRFSGLGRLTHWLHALFMALLMATGWGIYSGGYFFSDYATNLSIHMITGFGMIMVCLAVGIYFWIAEPKHIKTLVVTPSDIKGFITIALNFLGLTKKYPAYHIWDAKKEEYVSKYHPAMKFLHWGDYCFYVLVAVTGLGLYYPGTTIGFITSYWSLTLIRTIHLACLFYFIFTLMAHIYLSIIPVNRHLLVSMISGEDTGEDTVRV